MKQKISLNEKELHRLINKAVKRCINESDETNAQWKGELAQFMRGLRDGRAIIQDDVVYVQIYRGSSPSNDPRYVYFKRGGNRLTDDHFYMQNSPILSKRTIRTINRRAGWDNEEM